MRSPRAATAAPAAPAGWQARHTQLLLLFLARLVQSVLRMAMGPLVVYVCEDAAMGCTDASKGSLLSAFALGYLFTQVPGGFLADAVGARAVVAAAAAAAGLLTFAGGGARTWHELWLLQALMGAAQGPLFPTSIAHLSVWLPRDERALASTVLDAGITAGSLVVLPFAGRLAAAAGWRGALRAYGVGAVAFAALWWAYAVATPRDCATISKAELALLERPRAAAAVAPCSPTGIYDPPRRAARSKGALLSHAALWAVFLSHAAFNFGTYFLTSWQPTYFLDVLGVAPEAAALAFAAAPGVRRRDRRESRNERRNDVYLVVGAAGGQPRRQGPRESVDRARAPPRGRLDARLPARLQRRRIPRLGGRAPRARGRAPAVARLRDGDVGRRARLRQPPPVGLQGKLHGRRVARGDGLRLRLRQHGRLDREPPLAPRRRPRAPHHGLLGRVLRARRRRERRRGRALRRQVDRLARRRRDAGQ